MASIKDAYEEALQDNLSIIKFFVFAIPLYYSYHLYVTSKADFTWFWSVAIFTFMLLFGFLIKCATNVMNFNNHVLPSFNIFNLFWTAIKGLIALGPSIAINTYLAIFITSKILLPVPWLDVTTKIIVWGIFMSIVMTSFLLYTKHQKISDAYNFKIISNSCIDILIAILFFLPQLAIVNAIIVGLITYLLWLFLGIPNPFLTFVWCMSIIFNLAIIGNYLAQIDYESINTKGKED